MTTTVPGNVVRMAMSSRTQPRVYSSGTQTWVEKDGNVRCTAEQQTPLRQRMTRCGTDQDGLREYGV